MVCNHSYSIVINSRPEYQNQFRSVDIPYHYYRRRECEDCGLRFTTLEVTPTAIHQFTERRSKSLTRYKKLYLELSSRLEALCKMHRSS